MNRLRFSNVATMIFLIGILSCETKLGDFSEAAGIQNSSARKAIDPIFLSYDLEKYNIEPLWETAVDSKNGIEVLFTVKKLLPRSNTKGSLKKQGRQKLVMVKNGNKVSCVIMNFIPSADFKGNMSNITSQNYQSKKFDGLITVRQINEDSFQIWHISNGINVKKSSGRKTKKNARVAEFVEVCIDYAQDTDWYHWTGTEWEYMYTITEYFTECHIEDDGTSSGGGIPPYVDPLDCNVNPFWPWCNVGGIGDPVIPIDDDEDMSKCKPCTPVDVGGLAYEYHSEADDNKPHKGMKEHTHHFRMNQSPPKAGCKCFWDRDYIDPTPGLSPKKGAVEVSAAGGGGIK